MAESIEDKLARAWSIESIYRHKDKAEGITCVGSVLKEARLYRVYEDSDGDTWYRKFFVDTDTGEIITEEEKIFGHHIKHKYRTGPLV